jgi:hypothetical protein
MPAAVTARTGSRSPPGRQFKAALGCRDLLVVIIFAGIGVASADDQVCGHDLLWTSSVRGQHAVQHCAAMEVVGAHTHTADLARARKFGRMGFDSCLMKDLPSPQE